MRFRAEPTDSADVLVGWHRTGWSLACPQCPLSVSEIIRACSHSTMGAGEVCF